MTMPRSNTITTIARKARNSEESLTSYSSKTMSPSSHTKSPFSITTLSLLMLLLITLAIHSCDAQQYHFSNGWYPGKKRASASPSGAHFSGSSDAAAAVAALTGAATRSHDTPLCSLRPETLLIINKLLQEEAARIQRNCVAESQIGLRDLLEGTNGKLDDEKW